MSRIELVREPVLAARPDWLRHRVFDPSLLIFVRKFLILILSWYDWLSGRPETGQLLFP